MEEAEIAHVQQTTDSLVSRSVTPTIGSLPINQRVYGNSLRRRQDFLSKWDKIATTAISSSRVDLRVETLPLFGDFCDPSSLMDCFLAAAEASARHPDQETRFTGSSQGVSWTLLCDAAVVTRDQGETIKLLINSISNNPIPESSKKYCLQTLAALLVIQTQAYLDIESLSKLLHQHLGCSVEELSAAITILVTLGSSFRTVSDLGARRLEEAMQIILPRTRSLNRGDIVFAQARLFYLAYHKRLKEYEYFYRRMQQQPGALLRLYVNSADNLTKKYFGKQRPPCTVALNDPWYEMLRPGITLACSMDGMVMQTNVETTAHHEFTTRIMAADLDSDVLTARYLWMLQQALRNIDYGRLTFITSIYRGKEWLKGFLENMTSLDQFERSTLLLFNACSPESDVETEIIRHHQEKWHNIIHVRLDRDPGLYNIWNLGISLARSEYISNANIDDRKANDFITSHLEALQSSDQCVSLVSAPCYICTEKNAVFELYKSDKDEKKLSYYHGPEYYSYPDLFLDSWNPDQAAAVIWRNLPHCMPVWRKELHARYGLFDERLGGAAADLEFWLRCTKAGEVFRNLNTPKGLYYYSSSTTYSARKGQSLEFIGKLHISRQCTANQSAQSKTQL